MLRATLIAATMSIGGLGTALAAPPGVGALHPAPSAQNVDYRRCWYDDGVRYCRWVRTDYYDDDLWDLPWGGPVFRFSFGGGPHFGGHGHHGHGRR